MEKHPLNSELNAVDLCGLLPACTKTEKSITNSREQTEPFYVVTGKAFNANQEVLHVSPLLLSPLIAHSVATFRKLNLNYCSAEP